MPHARKLDRITYDEMLELASLGAKVLQIRSVEFAMRYGVPVHVRSSFNDAPGTWVVARRSSRWRTSWSRASPTIATRRRSRCRAVPDRPGLAARIFGPARRRGDRRRHDHPERRRDDGTTDITFTVPRGDLRQGAEAIVRAAASATSAAGRVVTDGDIAKVSIVGLGMRSHAGVAAQHVRRRSRSEGINIQMISTSEIKISVVIDAKYIELAVRALHDAFVGGGTA